MTPDDFREGILRIFPRELLQQIQIACHSFESISPPPREIRQNCLGPRASNFTFAAFSRNLTAQ
jgi:hypothetical protein